MNGCLGTVFKILHFAVKKTNGRLGTRIALDHVFILPLFHAVRKISIYGFAIYISLFT